MEFLKALSYGWVSSLIGLIGLIGVVITYLLYRASRIGPRPVYQYRALRLIGRAGQALPEEVIVLFRDKKVQRLTKTHIVLWNSGTAIVKGENIVTDDPLRLEFSKDSEVLSVRILTSTHQWNKFTANINPDSPNEVICDFDYLNAKDGVVLELLHTAKERSPSVQGTIRGVPKGLLNWGHIFPSPELQTSPLRLISFLQHPIARKSLMVFGLLSGMFFVAYGAIKPTMIGLITGGTNDWPAWIFVMFGVIFIIGYSHLLWTTRRRFPKSLSIEDTE